MARSYWNIVLGALVATGLAGGMGWVLWAQSPASDIAPPPLDRFITVGLSGQKMRCKVLQSWGTPSGGQAYRVSVVESGENLTVVREGSGDGKEMPVRIFRWSDANTSPAGAPAPPPVSAAATEKTLTASEVQDLAKKSASSIEPPPSTQVASASTSATTAPSSAPRTIAPPESTPLIPEAPAPVVAAATTPVVVPTATPLPTIVTPPVMVPAATPVAIAQSPAPQMPTPKPPIIIENTTPIATVRPPIIINGTDDSFPQRGGPAPTLMARNTPTPPPAIEPTPVPEAPVATPLPVPSSPRIVPALTPPASPVADLAPNINHVTPMPTVATTRPETATTFSTSMDPNGQAPWSKGEPLVIPGKSTLEVSRTAPPPANNSPKNIEPAPLPVMTAAQPVSDLPAPRPTVQPEPVVAPIGTSPKTLPPPVAPKTPLPLGREVIAIPASRPTSSTPVIAPPPAISNTIAPPPTVINGPDLGSSIVAKETIIEVPCDEAGRLLPPSGVSPGNATVKPPHKSNLADLFHGKKPGETGSNPKGACPTGTCPPGGCATGACATGACATGVPGTLSGVPTLPNPPGCTLCPGGAAAPAGACAGQVPVSRVVGNKASMYDRLKAAFLPNSAPHHMPPSNPTLISSVPYGGAPAIPYESSAKTYQPVPAGFDRTAVPGGPVPTLAADGAPKSVLPAGFIPEPIPGAVDRTRVAIDAPTKTTAKSSPAALDLTTNKDKVIVVNETPASIAGRSPLKQPTPFIPTTIAGLSGKRADDHPAMPVIAEMPASPPESPAAKASRIWKTGMVDPKLFSASGAKLAFPAPTPTRAAPHPALASVPTTTIPEPNVAMSERDRWKGIFYLKKDAAVAGSQMPPMPVGYPMMGYQMGYPVPMAGAPMNAFHNTAPQPPFNAWSPPMVPVAYGYPQTIPYGNMPLVQPVNYEQSAPQGGSQTNNGPAPGDRKVLAHLIQTAKESPHPAQREWAVMSLATYEVQAHPQIVAFLSQVALNDPAGAVRASAVNTLKRLNVPAQVIYTTLQSLRHDSDVRVRTAVEEACEAR